MMRSRNTINVFIRLAAPVGGFAMACLLFSSFNMVEAQNRAAADKKNPAATNGRVDWRLEKTTGERPSARGAGKWVALGNKLVAFGGFIECFDKSKCDHTYYNDVYILDLATNRWEKRKPVSASGALPDGRAFLGASAYKKKGTAVFFGGAQYNATLSSVKVYGDLWEYDPKTDRMTERAYANQGPGARLGAEIAIKDDTLYLFGGYDKGFKAHNDLWSYDLLTNTWRQLRKDDDPKSPSKRYIFRFELSESGDDIYIFGGNYRETYTIQRNDLWRYNIPSDTFVEVISEKNTNTTGRTHGAAAIFGDVFIIALGDIPSGGCFTNQASEHQNPTNEVWSLRVGARPDTQWKQVKTGFTPPPLKRVYYAQAGDRLYVTHGFNFKCDKGATEGAIYNLNTYSLPLRPITQ
ncbi:MAG TPA: kelch repeat-containing protein [Blastocatellia bacterium]|nr:kelch repeat-containing protein [Blastocatellia bacterium]